MSRRHKTPLPTEPVIAQIERFAHDGRGVARLQGKTVFVSGSLPGETVAFRYLAQQKRFAEAHVVEVLDASPTRVLPQCPHFGLCGGCCLQHLAPDAQLALKQATLLELFQHVGKVSPEQTMPPLTGNYWGYRHKARLGVKYVEKKQSVLVGFREQQRRFIAELTQCAILHPLISQQIPTLRELLNQLESRAQIAQIEVAVGDTQAALIFRNLVPLSERDQQQLIEFAQTTGIYLYLQPAGPDTVYPLWPPELPLLSLEYTLPTERISIQFAPQDFTQVNFSVNRQMVTQALTWLDLQPTDTVLELFCGLGNFTLPLARQAAHVVGVEGEANLLARAQMNAQRQGISNISYQVADLTKPEQLAAWEHHVFTKVLLDPPRSGALDILRTFPFNKTQRIVYISCNPATVARDTQILVQERGFRLVYVGVMDMFPHTAHLESMALFLR